MIACAMDFPRSDPRMRRQSIMVRASQISRRRPWPEFQEINAALSEYLAQVIDRVICDAVYKEAGGCREVPEPAKIGERKW